MATASRAGASGAGPRAHELDGALLFFDRESGVNVRLEGPSLRGLERRAPRVLHVGLTNRCNLRCSFCFRDRALASAWTADDIVAWAEAFAAAGALEIAFGQGEPLLFAGFTDLVRRVHERTPLGVSFTTNGLRLTPAVLGEIEGAYGQIRLSYYDDNAPLARARALAGRGARFGVNLLVTPARLASLRATLEALAGEGCGDVLLLSYNGPDPSLHLSRDDDRAFARVLLDLHARHGEALALKLSVCFGRRLFEVPQLTFGGAGAPGADCGAGDDFLAVDSEKRLSACSFQAGAGPVRTPAEALAAYLRARAARAPAGVRGCARGEGAAGGAAPARGAAGGEAFARGGGAAGEHRAFVFRGWASNHSTSYTLVGEFASATKATAYVDEMRRLLARCAAPDEARRGGAGATVWQVLGREGPPPNYDFEGEASRLAAWRPDVIVAGGRRVLVHSDSTLADLRVFASLLLERHGRPLWHLTERRRPFWLVFGADVGGEATALARRLGPLLRDLCVVGPRLYGVAQSHDAWRLAPELEPLRRSIAVVDAGVETLAAALAAPAPRPPPKRRVGWLYLSRQSIKTFRYFLSELQRDPAAALAEHGWAAPFRLPHRFEARPLLGGVVARVEGAPLPPALCYFFMRRGSPWWSLVDQEGLSVHVELPAGEESEPGGPRPPSARAVDGLSKPGWSIDVGPYRTHLTILPRRPLATFEQLDALYGEARDVHVELSPERPLADAVAKIGVDLDAGS